MFIIKNFETGDYFMGFQRRGDPRWTTEEADAKRYPVRDIQKVRHDIALIQKAGYTDVNAVNVRR